MTRIEQIEAAIASLPEEEYAQFRRWFLEHIASRDATAKLLLRITLKEALEFNREEAIQAAEPDYTEEPLIV